MKLGLPGIAMICVEWASFEVGAFVVGSIDKVQLAINAVMINIITIAFAVSDPNLLMKCFSKWVKDYCNNYNNYAMVFILIIFITTKLEVFMDAFLVKVVNVYL